MGLFDQISKAITGIVAGQSETMTEAQTATELGRADQHAEASADSSGGVSLAGAFGRIGTGDTRRHAAQGGHCGRSDPAAA